MCENCNGHNEYNEHIETIDCGHDMVEKTISESMDEQAEVISADPVSEAFVCPHCSGKMTQRDEKQKKLLQNRLRRIEGQVRGLQSMLEQDAYCNDILVQSAAVSAALNSFNRELLENHIRHCVARDIREGKDEVIDELMGTLKKLMK